MHGPASLLQLASTTVWWTWVVAAEKPGPADGSDMIHHSELTVNQNAYVLDAVENCSTVPFRNVNVCGRVLFSWCRVPSQMICVLSSLSFRRLLAIQSRMRSRQLAKRSIASWHESAGTLIYSCVLSAYAWLVKPNSDTMSNSSDTYSKNSSGPKTDSCGTPKSNWSTSDKHRL